MAEEGSHREEHLGGSAFLVAKAFHHVVYTVMKKIILARIPWEPFSLLRVILLILPVTMTCCKKDQLPPNADPEKFTYLTEEYAPFNYSENGFVNGVSVDILEDLFKKMNLSLDRSVVQVSKWASAYETTLTQPNTMLFSTVKTSERAGLFKWVGPIAPLTEIVVSRKSSGIVLREVTDLNNYFTGVVEGYSSIDVLMDKGVLRPNIIIYSSLAELYKALIVNMEIQCVSTSLAGHNLIIQALGYDAANFSYPFTVQTNELFFAFNIGTADELITKFQEQLDLLKSDRAADGSSGYEKILRRYHIIQQAEDGITDEMVINLVDLTSADLVRDAAGTIVKMNQGLAPYKDAQNPALYSFAYNTDVVMVAHAANLSTVGVSFAGKPDVAGKNFRDEIVQGALDRGTGWVDYVYTMPDQSGLYYKTTYYKLTIGSDSKKYIVCSGKYK